MPLPLSFTTLDVFTPDPFRGNQLAIIHLTHPIPQSTKQAIAREFNFSETVFLSDVPPEFRKSGSQTEISNETTAADTSFTLRFLETFTTTQELPFAGHPTIGTVHYLCSHASPPLTKVNLVTKSGVISGSYDGGNGRAEATLPHNIRIHASTIPISAILSSQPGLLAEGWSFPDAPVVSLVKGLSFALVNCSQHPSALGKLRGTGQRIEEGAVKMDEGWAEGFVGIYYFCLAEKKGDVSMVTARMLEEGIGEDAATGSAASCLASYLALRYGKGGRIHPFVVQQGVEFGRASEISVMVELAEDGKSVRSVTLGGSAVVVTEGTIYVPDVDS